MTQKQVLLKMISLLLCATLLYICCFADVVYAGKTVLSDKIFYHLDLGVQLAYNEGSDWGSREYGKDSINVSPSISMGTNVEVVDAYAYEGSGYDIDSGSENLFGSGSGQENYDRYYKKYVSLLMTIKNFRSNGSTISFSYAAQLESTTPLDVVDMGTNLMDSKVYELFGGKDALEEQYPEIADAIEVALTAGRNGTAGTNRLYLIFCPTVIEYKKYITIGDLEAALELPESAKQEEEYAVADASLVDSSITVDYAILEKRYGTGDWETVTTWEGPGAPGENTGGRIDESCPDVCTITYKLSVYDVNGQFDTATETIRITDKREISVEADLILPPYTFEGHKELALDQSMFEVDGVAYSAARAYAEDIARNSFKANSSYGTVTRLTDTKADVTFEKRGTYTVTLTVDPISGSNATDTETIEVRKTPYIMESLSGVQKQNRKQTLDIAVATYPGKPITEYTVTLKDRKTGESITLSEDNSQENTTTIKTRTIRMTESEDGCFAYITLEFLTKTPTYNSADPEDTQDFSYEINVKDSKGDTDTASKIFSVRPDVPPTAAISLDTAFLRNEASNTASIKVEDVTVASDGDSVERTWYYGATTSPAAFTNISAMDGYKKLSFGTDKIVGFNKVGVGKFTAKLFVKEVWTEPTLEEYVADSDHLTGTTTAVSDVQNVAPIVSLEMLSGKEQEILLVANNNTELQTLMNNKTALQQALLAHKIDGQIIIKKLTGGTPGNITGITALQNIRYPYGYNNAAKRFAADSEKVYVMTHTWNGAGINAAATVPYTIHAIDPYVGEVWSYVTNRSEIFNFGQDDTGKYLYLIYPDSKRTVMLDKRTGAEAGVINTMLREKVWLTDQVAFIAEPPNSSSNHNNLYAIDLSSLTKVKVDENVQAVSRVGGNLQYVTFGDNAVVRCTLDMETFEIIRHIIIETPDGVASAYDYNAVCIDSMGKVVLWKNAGTGTDQLRGVVAVSADKEILRRISVPFRESGAYGLAYALDEEGKCNYIIEREKETSGTDTYSTIGINLNTGASDVESSHSTNFALIDFDASFESNGTAHFMFGGDYQWYDKGSQTWHNPYYDFSFNGSNSSFGVMGPGSFGSVDQAITTSDRFAASIDADNDPGTPYMRLKILGFPRTLAQETKELIARFTEKHTLLGNVSTTAEQIKAAVEAPKGILKVAAAQNGYLTLNNIPLKENKQYYYAFDIKPLTKGTENKLNGITAVSSSIMSNQPFLSDAYYVEKTYSEDFSDESTEKFFKLGAGLHTGYGAFGADMDEDTSYGSLTFTVPAGKKAIVSYDIRIITIDTPRFSSGTYINGERAYTEYIQDEVSETRHYTHYKLLQSGANLIEVRNSGNNGAVLIDNLKVEILSTSKPILKTTISMQQGDSEGWLDIEGSFETPNGNISYGAQASAYYSGPLPSVVTRTDNKGKPTEIEYYQTVPAGYRQKGFAYPQASAESKRTPTATIAGTMYRLCYRADINSGDPVFLRTREAGSYTHYTYAGSNMHYSNIPRFDLITYPVNEVTLTDQIAFDETFTKYYFPKESSTRQTSVSIYLPKGEYLIKNLRLYYMENGHRIFLQNYDLEELSDLSNWTLSSGLTASIAAETEEETDDDEYVKIYKKGEKVLYNIFYSDYEEDPSKLQYWVYSHLNWPPDGVHPDAGKVLNKPIDKFYLSGKYTVTHWQMDNTQRTGTAGDASGYNRESNRVDLTFYVDGEGKAPWITYIKTNPTKVKENSSYSLAVGVDDSEKDVLKLETEVYLNGRNILTNTQNGIAADASGNYPELLISGLPAAKTGVYQVICTVSDYSGTGIKAYKFTVVSEGKVTGAVGHTEQWDKNRKKYNLKRFAEEGNRSLQIGDYIAMPTPRLRGTNVFWSGEKFMLYAATEGEASAVRAEIFSQDLAGSLIRTGYTAELGETGRTAGSGEELWEGSLWNSEMINLWGRKTPEELIFRFTASYPEGMTKTHTVTVIIDSDRDYWQLHRLW